MVWQITRANCATLTSTVSARPNIYLRSEENCCSALQTTTRSNITQSSTTSTKTDYYIQYYIWYYDVLSTTCITRLCISWCDVKPQHNKVGCKFFAKSAILEGTGVDLELKPLRFLHSMVLILTDCPFLIGGSENSFKYLGFHWLTRRSECLKCAKYFRSSRTSYSHHRSNRQFYVCNNDVLQCYYIYQMVVVSMISIYTEKNSKPFAAKIFKISKSFAATLG